MPLVTISQAEGIFRPTERIIIFIGNMMIIKILFILTEKLSRVFRLRTKIRENTIITFRYTLNKTEWSTLLKLHAIILFSARMLNVLELTVSDMMTDITSTFPLKAGTCSTRFGTRRFTVIISTTLKSRTALPL